MDLRVRMPEFTGCDSVCVVVNGLSNYAYFIAASSSMTGAPWLFKNHACKLDGFPRGIIADKHPKFVGDAFMTRLTIDHNMTAANHPKAEWPEGTYEPRAHTIPGARCARHSVCMV